MSEDEILYGKRKAPEVMKEIDSITKEVNTKIKMRGIAKGLVCTQEEFNRDALNVERNIYWASVQKDSQKREEYLKQALYYMKDISIVLRYMLKNHVMKPGEIGVVSQHKKAADTQIYKWLNSSKDK